MSESIDPFADLETNTDSTAEEAPVTNDTVSNNAKIVTTLKAGNGYNAPWTVIHADTPEEALAVLNNPIMQELLDKTKEVGEYFGGKADAPASKPAGGKPAGASQPPADAPDCPPGWTFKSGFSQKTNKPWKAYFPPRGDDSKPIFFN